MTEDLKQTLTVATELSDDLEAQLAHAQGRREKKIADSALGIFIALIGVAVLAVAAFLFIQSVPAIVAGTITLKSAPIIIAAAATAVGIVFIVFGALVADKETVWPVLKGMVALAIRIRRGGSDK